MRPSRPAVPGCINERPPNARLPDRCWVLLLALVLASSATGIIATVGTGGPSGFGMANPSRESRLDFLATVLAVPSPPRNLVASPSALELLITLTWEPPDDPGGLLPVLGYKVYRGESGGSKGHLADVPLVTTYADVLVERGVTYCYEVRAFNLDGDSDPSNEDCATLDSGPPTAPGPPRSLAATAGDATVELTWSAPADEGGKPITNYHIHRGTTPDGESKYATVGEVFSYIDNGVTNGVTYYYKVSAENEVGEGPLSEEASATPEASPTVPGPPTGLAATVGDGFVELTWSAPAEEGSKPITNYHIHRGTTPGGESRYATVDNVLTYTDNGVTNGVTYYYKVSAENAVGEGTLSEETSATPEPPPSVPGPPTGLAATAGDATVELTWSAPAENGRRPIAHYHIYRGTTPNGQGESKYATVGDVLKYTDNGVTNGETYYYRVSAENEVGEGPRSEEASAKPEAPPTPPSPPVDLRATAGDGTVLLEWSAPAGDGGTPVTNYSVWRGTASRQLTRLTTLPDARTFQDSSVTNGETYYYHVTAINAAGEGEPSNEVPATPSPAPTVPDPPADLTAVAGDGRVSLAWQRPPSEGGSPITGYNLYRGGTAGGPKERLASVSGDVLSHVDTAVSNGVTYYYVVRAANAVGEGEPSNEVPATPSPAPTVPDAVRDLTAQGGDAQVTLTWSPPANQGGRPITNYRIYRGTNSGDRSNVTTTGDATTHTDVMLTNGKTYYYVVTAVNEIGEGPPSAEVPATPATVPNAPGNVRAIPGDGQVTIQWTGPYDGGAAITSYRILRGTVSGSLSHVATTGPVDSYVDTDRTNNQPYFYQVRAVNRVGEGPLSEEVSATPTQGPSVPGAPESLIATAGDRQVQLTWSAPISDGRSPITEYAVYRGLRADNLTLFARAGTATSLLDGTVTNGVKYFYAVTARNAQGEGPRSAIASAIPRAPGPDRAPTVQFTFPQSGETVQAGELTVTGTASDDTAVVRVDVSADGATWGRASGTGVWSGTLSLAEGRRTIHARATDATGKWAVTNLTINVQPVGPGGSGGEAGGTGAPGPLVVVAALLSFTVTAVSAWFFLNRRRTRY